VAAPCQTEYRPDPGPIPRWILIAGCSLEQMTHLYTLLVGGTVIPGDGPEVEAIAWADDTILTLGSESDVRAISRGDSDIVELDGEFVIPVGPDGPTWPSGARSRRSRRGAATGCR